MLALSLLAWKADGEGGRIYKCFHTLILVVRVAVVVVAVTLCRPEKQAHTATHAHTHAHRHNSKIIVDISKFACVDVGGGFSYLATFGTF